MKAIWLSLFIAVWSSSASALPSPCLSSRFQRDIEEAVDIHWRDFRAPEWWHAQMCQESHLNPDAVSPVGAQGLAQIMPATYADIIRELKWDAKTTAFNPERAIRAGAYYQGKMRRGWGAEGRTAIERNRLGLCSYNAGFGNCLKAQTACGGSRAWDDISPCMVKITGHYARETLTYVSNITRFAGELKEKWR